MTGKKPAGLEQEELPECLAHIWLYYNEVFTGEALTYSELYSWSRMTRRNLSAFEVDLIKSLERAWYRWHYGRNSKPSN